MSRSEAIESFLTRHDDMLRWLARRCVPRWASPVWSHEDVLQEFRAEALALRARYASRPVEELTYIMLRALPRHARRELARVVPPPGVTVFAVDVRDFLDPAWAAPFARAEVLRELDRLEGLPHSVAREVLDPSPRLAAAVVASLGTSRRRPRYVTIGDVAAELGVGVLRAYRAFEAAVGELAARREGVWEA